jgi:hypothetical protein
LPLRIGNLHKNKRPGSFNHLNRSELFKFALDSRVIAETGLIQEVLCVGTEAVGSLPGPIPDPVIHLSPLVEIDDETERQRYDPGGQRQTADEYAMD